MASYNGNKAVCRDESEEQMFKQGIELVDPPVDTEAGSDDESFIEVEMPGSDESPDTVQSEQPQDGAEMAGEKPTSNPDQAGEHVSGKQQEQVGDEQQQEHVGGEPEQEQVPEPSEAGPDQRQDGDTQATGLDIDPSLSQEDQTELMEEIITLVAQQLSLKDEEAQIRKDVEIAATLFAAVQAQATALSNERDNLYQRRKEMHTHRSQLHDARNTLDNDRRAIYAERNAAFARRSVAYHQRPRDELLMTEVDNEIAAIDRRIKDQESKIRDQKSVIGDWDRKIASHERIISKKDDEISEHATVVTCAQDVLNNEKARLTNNARVFKEVTRKLEKAQNKLAGRASPGPVTDINYLTGTTTIEFWNDYEGHSTVTFHQDGGLNVRSSEASYHLGPGGTICRGGGASVVPSSSGWAPFLRVNATIMISGGKGLLYTCGCRVYYECDAITDEPARVNITCCPGRTVEVNDNEIVITST